MSQSRDELAFLLRGGFRKCGQGLREPENKSQALVARRQGASPVIWRSITAKLWNSNRHWGNHGLAGFAIVFFDRLRNQFAGPLHKITIFGQLQNILAVKIFSRIPALEVDAFDFAQPDEYQNF